MKKAVQPKLCNRNKKDVLLHKPGLIFPLDIKCDMFGKFNLHFEADKKHDLLSGDSRKKRINKFKLGASRCRLDELLYQ